MSIYYTFEELKAAIDADLIWVKDSEYCYANQLVYIQDRNIFGYNLDTYIDGTSKKYQGGPPANPNTFILNKTKRVFEPYPTSYTDTIIGIGFQTIRALITEYAHKRKWGLRVFFAKLHRILAFNQKTFGLYGEITRFDNIFTGTTNFTAVRPKRDGGVFINETMDRVSDDLDSKYVAHYVVLESGAIWDTFITTRVGTLVENAKDGMKTTQSIPEPDAHVITAVDEHIDVLETLNKQEGEQAMKNFGFNMSNIKAFFGPPLANGAKTGMASALADKIAVIVARRLEKHLGIKFLGKMTSIPVLGNLFSLISVGVVGLVASGMANGNPQANMIARASAYAFEGKVHDLTGPVTNYVLDSFSEILALEEVQHLCGNESPATERE